MTVADIFETRDQLIRAGFSQEQAEAQTRANARFAESTDFVTNHSLQNVQDELKQEISNVQNELKQEIGNVRNELKHEINNVESGLKREIAKVEYDGKLTRWMVTFNMAISATTLWMVFKLVASSTP